MPISNIAIKGDGSEIVVGGAGRAEGDWLGSVAVYTRPSAAGPTRTPRTRNGSAPGPNHRFGWQVAYDQSNGDIYTSAYSPPTGSQLRTTRTPPT